MPNKPKSNSTSTPYAWRDAVIARARTRARATEANRKLMMTKRAHALNVARHAKRQKEQSSHENPVTTGDPQL